MPVYRLIYLKPKSFIQSCPKLRLLPCFFIYGCLVFPQLCYSSSRLHLNYTLALLQNGKLNFISRSTEEMLTVDVSKWRNVLSQTHDSLSQQPSDVGFCLLVLETMWFPKNRGNQPNRRKTSFLQPGALNGVWNCSLIYNEIKSVTKAHVGDVTTKQLL